MTAFLTRCADYQLLDASCDDKDNKTLLHLLNLEHLLNNNSNGEEEHDTSDDKSSNAFKLDPSTARLLKIARFKRQRQLKESIQVI